VKLVALAVLVVVALVSLVSLRQRPTTALADFIAIARQPWGRQLMVDFYGLEIVLVLWMATHAQAAGTWVAFAACAAAMPVFGAMAAAAYWLIAVA
jgi:hypothetical protein